MIRHLFDLLSLKASALNWSLNCSVSAAESCCWFFLIFHSLSSLKSSSISIPPLQLWFTVGISLHTVFFLRLCISLPVCWNTYLLWMSWRRFGRGAETPVRKSQICHLLSVITSVLRNSHYLTLSSRNIYPWIVISNSLFSLWCKLKTGIHLSLDFYFFSL